MKNLFYLILASLIMQGACVYALSTGTSLGTNGVGTTSGATAPGITPDVMSGYSVRSVAVSTTHVGSDTNVDMSSAPSHGNIMNNYGIDPDADDMSTDSAATADQSRSRRKRTQYDRDRYTRSGARSTRSKTISSKSR